MNSGVLILFFLALSEKPPSNLSQASWAVMRLGHWPPERGLLKYAREIKINIAAKPQNLRMLHVVGSCNNKQQYAIAQINWEICNGYRETLRVGININLPQIFH